MADENKIQFILFLNVLFLKNTSTCNDFEIAKSYDLIDDYIVCRIIKFETLDAS